MNFKAGENRKGGRSNTLVQAQQIWDMLDEMALTDPESYQSFIKKQLEEGAEMMPQPHCCVETTMTKPRKDKLFINIFKCSHIPPPKSYRDPVPVMGGAPIWSQEKHGEDIMCVAFNPEILKEFDNKFSQEEKNTLINLAIDFLCDQNDVIISRNFNLLHSEKFKGDLTSLKQSFSLKTPSRPNSDKLQPRDHDNIINIPGIHDATGEMSLNKVYYSSTSKDDSDLTTENMTNRKVLLIEELPSDFQYTVERRTDADGSLYSHIAIYLPGIKSIKQCELNVSKDYIKLTISRSKHLTVPLPANSQDERASAKFFQKTSKLVITVPIINS